MAKSASDLAYLAPDGGPGAHARAHSGGQVGVHGYQVAALLAVLAGCASELPGEDIASESYAATVGSYETSSCSTSVVLGLSVQIAEEVGCIDPQALVPFEEGDGIVFTGSAVLPYLSAKAKDDVRAAVAASGMTLQVNSAYRTVAQQYLLYRWFQLGRCGITAAATPGNSNHESGRALDVNNYSQWIGALGNAGWSHDIPGDPVHFDHLASPDIRGMDVLAFQRLWNRNHPEDQIGEDGDYGPATAARLKIAPAEGFAVGVTCGAPPADSWNAALVAGAATQAESGAVVTVTVELTNTGNTTWKPGETFLGTTQPRDRMSLLYDAADWTSPGRPTSVDAETAPGAVGQFTFTLQAPDVDAETTFSESFGLVQEGVTWFGPEDVVVELTVQPPGVDVPGDGVGPGDGSGEDEEAGTVVGACAVGAGGGRGVGGVLWIVGAMAAMAQLRRRRARVPAPE